MFRKKKDHSKAKQRLDELLAQLKEDPSLENETFVRNVAATLPEDLTVGVTSALKVASVERAAADRAKEREETEGTQKVRPRCGCGSSRFDVAHNVKLGVTQHGFPSSVLSVDIATCVRCQQIRFYQNDSDLRTEAFTFDAGDKDLYR